MRAKTCTKYNKGHKKANKIKILPIDYTIARHLAGGGQVFFCETNLDSEHIRNEVTKEIARRIRCAQLNISFYSPNLKLGQSFWCIKVVLPNPNQSLWSMKVIFYEKFLCVNKSVKRG